MKQEERDYLLENTFSAWHGSRTQNQNNPVTLWLSPAALTTLANTHYRNPGSVLTSYTSLPLSSLSLSLSSQSSPWRHRKPTRNILKAEPRTPRTQQLRVRMGDGGDVNNSRERQKTWTEPPVSRWKHLPFTLPDKAPLFIIPSGSTFGSFPNNFSSFL